MALNDTAKEAALDHLGTLIAQVSLHDADPGTTGINEIASAGYAKQSVTWNPAAAGNLDSSNTQEFSMTSGDVVAWVGLWDGAGTTFYGSKALAASETFSNDGTFTVNDLDINLSDV